MTIPVEQCYQILGLPRDASREEVRQGFERLSHAYHPARNPLMMNTYRRINRAYQTLMAHLDVVPDGWVPEATAPVESRERRLWRGRPTDRRFELVTEAHYLGTSIREVI